jgi:hypothetical protein
MQPGGRIERPPFSLPTGLSEGRPDITVLLNAREPHERLIREGALERRALAEQVRADSRARTAPTSPGGGGGGGGSGSPAGSVASPARAGLSALGFVPPGMVASGTLNALAAGMAAPAAAHLEPSRHARPPTAVGMYPTRPRTLEGRRPDLQALRQHDLSRSERAAGLALSQSGAWETAVGGWEGGGGGGGEGGLAAGWGAAGMHASSSTSGGGGEEGFGGWEGGGGGGGGGRGGSSGGGSPVNLPPLTFPPSLQGGGSTTGGGGGSGSGGPRLVRVGVAVEDILNEQRVTGGGSQQQRSPGSSSAGVPGRRPLPSPMHPRTPYGTIRAPADIEAAAARMPQFVRPSRAAFFAPTADEDYALTTAHPVAFRAAVKDLPAAAVQAVRDMLLDKAHLTVSNIHQRRPPYLDIGPGVTLANLTRREMHPEEFKGSLRRQAEDSMAPVKRRPFTLGATAPWNKGRYTISGMDTFDFIAKQSAVRYYVTDFTAPAPAAMRPPSRGVTRFASNVPSLVGRGEEVQRARETNRLLCVLVWCCCCCVCVCLCSVLLLALLALLRGQTLQCIISRYPPRPPSTHTHTYCTRGSMRFSKPHDQEDTTVNMGHLQERHIARPPLEAPGDRLVPYANTPLLPPTPKAIPPVSQSSSYRVYGTPRL